MDIVVAALVAGGVAAVVATFLMRGRGPAIAAGPLDQRGAVAERAAPAGPQPSAQDVSTRGDASARDDASDTSERPPPEAASPDQPAPEPDAELAARRAELARLEERLRARESSLDAQQTQLSAREQSLEDRARNLDHNAERLDRAKTEQLRELERIAGLSPGQARQLVLRELEEEARHDGARLIRQAEGEARHEAERRARSILSTCIQRVAAGHVVESTVSVVELRSDELKGRIIGREGRNIRALETITGIDFIIDDTPGAVLLSGFDGVRREVARLTLEKLLQDGRIHPARIEEAYEQSRSQLDERLIELGEQAAYEVGVGALDPELIKILGRLQFRTSYGQNVLAHSVECARLAGLLAGELGANARTASRAALLHDMGKAASHDIEGPHALVGGKLARRYGESEAVAHAMETHHNEIQPQTIEAVIVQIADAVSGARPGARGQSLERYVNRLHELEAVATRQPGVDKVYAMHAGREIRVIVRPEEVDDDAATLLSHRIAREVEAELEYPGQVKVTVIRESRATDYAT